MQLRQEVGDANERLDVEDVNLGASFSEAGAPQVPIASRGAWTRVKHPGTCVGDVSHGMHCVLAHLHSALLLHC